MTLTELAPWQLEARDPEYDEAQRLRLNAEEAELRRELDERRAIHKRNNPVEIDAYLARSFAAMERYANSQNAALAERSAEHGAPPLDPDHPDDAEFAEAIAAWEAERLQRQAESDARPKIDAEQRARAAERAWAEWQTEHAAKVATFLADIERQEEQMNRSLYVDVGAILSGDLKPVRPTLGHRSDGEPFIYDGKVNVLFGLPESGKTLVAAALAADCLFAGGSCLWIDADYNGADATLLRLRSFGVSAAVLDDFARFRLVEPQDRERVLAVVADAASWSPTMAVVDSISEILSLFGANPNADEDYTPVHRQTLAKLAATGAGVVAIDHEAKGQASKAYGAGGAVAKKRALDGVMLRVTRRRAFKPGEGGKADLTIVKDRHGGVRAISPSGEKEPLAATFDLSGGEATTWKFWAAEGSTTNSPKTNKSDAEIVAAINPRPSQYAARQQLGWGAERVRTAFIELGWVVAE